LTVLLLHLIPAEAWAAVPAAGLYRPGSLSEEGFIHASTASQVLDVAEALFAGRGDLLLLVIDLARVPAEIRFEDSYGAGQAFPHIYGPLPAEAVIAALKLAPGADGRFRLPRGLGRLLGREPLAIRPATAADSRAIARLLGQLGYPAAAEEVAARLAALEGSPSDAVLVGVLEGRPVASAGLHILPYFHNGERVCRLSSLVVEDGYRDLGLGDQMLRAVERWAAERGCQAVELTSAERRAAAHRFYEARGYRRAGVKFFKPLQPQGGAS
jgi:uncharacterized protein (DUF952 family)/N-acetylglutamate synthase-like GNAT family acetyltransferase